MGQRQTVAIARTLLNDPQLILLDEPTASLSVMQAAEVLSYIKRIRSDGRSVVMVCHDLPNVFAVSDRIVVIRQDVSAACIAPPRPPTRKSSRKSLALTPDVRARG